MIRRHGGRLGDCLGRHGRAGQPCGLLGDRAARRARSAAWPPSTCTLLWRRPCGPAEQQRVRHHGHVRPWLSRGLCSNSVSGLPPALLPCGRCHGRCAAGPAERRRPARRAGGKATGGAACRSAQRAHSAAQRGLLLIHRFAPGQRRASQLLGRQRSTGRPCHGAARSRGAGVRHPVGRLGRRRHGGRRPGSAPAARRAAHGHRHPRPGSAG
jgi:hypothetical protein